MPVEYGKPKHLRLSEESINTFKDLSDRYGMTEKAVIEKTVEWIIRQDGVVQHVILTPVPDELYESYAACLESMAKQLRDKKLAAGKPDPT